MKEYIAKVPINSVAKSNPYTIWVDDINDEICIFKNNDGNYIAYSNICPHFGGLFFKPKKDLIKCKFHGWVFNLKDGKCETYPNVNCKIKIYNCHIDKGDTVLISREKLLK